MNLCASCWDNGPEEAATLCGRCEPLSPFNVMTYETEAQGPECLTAGKHLVPDTEGNRLGGEEAVGVGL